MNKGETETIITFSKADKESIVWTNDIKITRKMKKLKLIEKEPNTFSIPVNWIHIYKPRNYTKLQKKNIKIILHEINPKIDENKKIKRERPKRPVFDDITIWKI